MTIQQTQSSGSSSGIMGFLFQDDGSTGGMPPDAEGFSVTLQQLLGDYDAKQKPPSAQPAAVNTSGDAELAAPLTAALEAPTSHMTLSTHGIALPADAITESAADGKETEDPDTGLTPFPDMTASREHLGEPNQRELVNVTTAKEQDTNNSTPPTPVFANGIHHVIELARDVQSAAATLTQRPAQPLQPLINPAGRNLPGGGKTLPQGFRPLTLSQAVAGLQTRHAQTTAANETFALSPGDTATNATFGAFVADLQNADTRAQPGPAAPAPAIVQGLRGENPMPALPAALAESTDTQTPQLQSPYIAGSEAWFEDLGTRVEWLNDMNIEQADLQLHPAELGLLEIHIATTDDGTTVSFVTHNAAARELIEDSLPKLRELLASQGMQLGESQVSQHSDSRQHEPGMNFASSAEAPDKNEEPAPARRIAYIADPNRIDHYV